MPNLGKLEHLVKPIALSEVHESLRQIWRITRAPMRVGIAVSGGMDSMALSKLCMSMPKQEKPEYHAFIVDHKARIGSLEEAHTVASRLLQFGLRSTILSLEWPKGVNPAELSNFETRARRLRYRTLGTACSNMNIETLLLAHHEDDVTESMLRNVTHVGRSPASWSLRAMAFAGANIPECWGMHGVHESGNHEAGQQSPEAAFNEVRHTTNCDMLPRSKGQYVDFEKGGVKIYRPLLTFSKARIKATCLDRGVDWVEDETNHDVTRTTRNAIRSLLNAQRLPKALCKDSMMTLNHRVVKNVRRQGIAGKRLLKRADILMFDIRSGSLVVRLPQPRPPSHDLDIMDFLKRLFEMVSPSERVLTPSMKTALHYIFGSETSSTETDEKQPPKQVKFCNGSVLAERVYLPIQQASDLSVSPDLDPQFIWILTRQPFPRLCAPEPMSIPAESSTVLSHPCSQTLHGDVDNGISIDRLETSHAWSAWKLWDGRFWIRVSNRTGQEVVLRPFVRQDWGPLESELPKTQFDQLCYNMSMTAPGHVRWTLPVIADTGHPRTVLAFPTLSNTDLGLIDGLEWEVRYKYVDFGSKELEPERIAR